MKKIIKPVFALVLITMGVIVLMKMNKIWALNPEQNPNEASELKSEQNLNEALEMKSEQNPNETSALNSKKNLNVEYFIRWARGARPRRWRRWSGCGVVLQQVISSY